MNKTITFTLLFLINNLLFSQDWKNIDVPVKLDEGYKWKLHPQSDDFNYQALGNSKNLTFKNRWVDSFHNPWKGPGLTEWNENFSEISDGYLKIKAGQKKGSKKINTGCITSKVRIKYPVFVESKVKISNSSLSCAVWMLSPDDTQEIDIIEAYGSDNQNNEWYSKRIHLSHHMFKRSPFEDYQPTDDDSWYFSNGTTWHEKWVRVGIYWKDPFTLEYYIDGEKVRVVEGMDVIDPNNYSETKGIYKEMDIIINAEDQTWRASNGLTPSKKELKDIEKNTFLVDWIRIYKPVMTDEFLSLQKQQELEKNKEVNEEKAIVSNDISPSIIENRESISVNTLTETEQVAQTKAINNNTIPEIVKRTSIEVAKIENNSKVPTDSLKTHNNLIKENLMNQEVTVKENSINIDYQSFTMHQTKDENDILEITSDKYINKVQLLTHKLNLFQEFTIDNKTTKLNVSKLPKGFYYINVLFDDKLATQAYTAKD
ncbi:LamG domain-containing protein [Aquimarina agarilytica]|uniref:beta-agarase n=1 Tax=Aquimarina agarilytica TaxID=1087449 RepID=UPI000288A474|nr:beta-agarase [Aquimarina agarilytica]